MVINLRRLREEEVRRILGQTEKVSRQQISEVPFEIGDAVKIKEGPFKDFDGVVDEIHPEKGKIKGNGKCVRQINTCRSRFHACYSNQLILKGV